MTSERKAVVEMTDRSLRNGKVLGGRAEEGATPEAGQLKQGAKKYEATTDNKDTRLYIVGLEMQSSM
jgi:hypothetical protein